MPKNSENTSSWLQIVTNSKEGYILSYPFTKKKNQKVLRVLEWKNWELGVKRLIFRPYD